MSIKVVDGMIGRDYVAYGCDCGRDNHPGHETPEEALACARGEMAGRPAYLRRMQGDTRRWEGDYGSLVDYVVVRESWGYCAAKVHKTP